ncbi:unnamed protein product [Moneuplotes crassus]|uniref:Uncharacterized protein n=1 Tax=Euplotes crassus TaxID=5936 RepID=A0AAD1U455_EUPCR|nr:unnamed protein product [Moneuplotes crassus]
MCYPICNILNIFKDCNILMRIGSRPRVSMGIMILMINKQLKGQVEDFNTIPNDPKKMAENRKVTQGILRSLSTSRKVRDDEQDDTPLWMNPPKKVQFGIQNKDLFCLRQTHLDTFGKETKMVNKRLKQRKKLITNKEPRFNEKLGKYRTKFDFENELDMQNEMKTQEEEERIPPEVFSSSNSKEVEQNIKKARLINKLSRKFKKSRESKRPKRNMHNKNSTINPEYKRIMSNRPAQRTHIINGYSVLSSKDLSVCSSKMVLESKKSNTLNNKDRRLFSQQRAFSPASSVLSMTLTPSDPTKVCSLCLQALNDTEIKMQSAFKQIPSSQNSQNPKLKGVLNSMVWKCDSTQIKPCQEVSELDRERRNLNLPMFKNNLLKESLNSEGKKSLLKSTRCKSFVQSHEREPQKDHLCLKCFYGCFINKSQSLTKFDGSVLNIVPKDTMGLETTNKDE